MRKLPRGPIPAEPNAIVEAVFGSDCRVLLLGQPGTGKSTLACGLSETLYRAGRTCRCLGADPGSPRFGVPGAVCLGRWDGKGWSLEGLEALCSLNAGRFRLPLVSAVARLARRDPPGTLLVDGPGVVRGVVGSELLSGLVEAAGIEVVLVLCHEGGSMPLSGELGALPVEAVAVHAAPAAHRPGKRIRARARTALWEAYLAGAGEREFPFDASRIIGTPPPPDVTGAWTGRQIALLRGDRTLAMGEVQALVDGILRVRVPATGPSRKATLLVRDAGRSADGDLATCAPFAPERLDYLPPPDLPPRPASVTAAGPVVSGRVGSFDICLVNGVFGDSLLHVRLRHARRSLLFDLGEGSRLPARIAHQVSDVFITHTHLDHIGGFLWLLRSRMGEFPACRLYGPPGLAANIEGFVRGVLWDRVEDRGPRFEVFELHGDCLLRFRIQAGLPGREAFDERLAPDGTLLVEPDFRVRATTLDHGSPVLAYVLEPSRQINVRKDRLQARGLVPGPWLGALKRRVLAGEPGAPIELPDGRFESVAALAADLILVTPGKNLVYATDFGDTGENRRRLVALAHNAHTMFCESTFLEEDAEYAERTGHLTTRACAGIAAEAGVSRLVPFHFSRRYEEDPSRIYEEIAQRCAAVAVPPSMSVFEPEGSAS
ncbi:MAG: hypothetical protein LJE91_00155 [Gammaproteobacteria bacterium]|jgi:ribonuclease BN (tRNA processing enzyme)|nr:hypothetical protein [Gammaproteobacteria bacterium]